MPAGDWLPGITLHPGLRFRMKSTLLWELMRAGREKLTALIPLTVDTSAQTAAGSCEFGAGGCSHRTSSGRRGT